MALSISIDVDDTLLDADGNLVPDALVGLKKLKTAGHTIQLWSAGGAEYAQGKATKHGIAVFFTSFARKPDVAIDDLLVMAKPSAIMLVNHEHSFMQAVEMTLKFESTVDAAQTVSQQVVEYIRRLQSESDQIRDRHREILRKDIPLHPVPFFGAIQQARVITVGLNPSSTEFDEDGRWPQQISADDLAQRLLDYFREPTITPHHWFADLQQAMVYLQCPYHLCAAHVDVSPWTTYSPSSLSKWDRESGAKKYPLLSSYNTLLDEGMKCWLPETLKLCKSTLKLVIACSSDAPKKSEETRLAQLAAVIQRAMGSSWSTDQFVVLPKSRVAQWTWERRRELARKLGVESVFT